jgi:putative tryptophan/tyrosine transport system substrate-binding protein
MHRRHFITLLGGFTACFPLAVRAQQPEQMRRIGVLMNRAADDLEGQTRFAVFKQSLQQLGWSDSRNVRIDSAGVRTMSTANANMRSNWLRSRRTSSSLLAP